jgi:hypothetical protein
MIELAIKKHLEMKLDVPVLLEYRPKGKRFIVFEKIGSSKKNHMNMARFAFQSYAESLYQAAKLNEDLKEAVESLIESDSIAFSKLESDYNFTDQETKKYRYQAVFEIKY